MMSSVMARRFGVLEESAHVFLSAWGRTAAMTVVGGIAGIAALVGSVRRMHVPSPTQMLLPGRSSLLVGR